MTSRMSENLLRSYAGVGLRALCKPSYTRRPLDKFRQVRHLAVCDLNSTGPRLQRREPPAQRKLRTKEQSAMASRSTAPLTEDFASLQQIALQAAKTGAEVRCMLASVLDSFRSRRLKVRPVAQVVQEALDKPRNIHFKGVTDLVTDTDRASEEAILKVVIFFLGVFASNAQHSKPG